MVEKRQQTAYEIIGGEQAVKILVERFYYYMATLPEAADVRAMHAADLTAAKQKLFKFLSGWLGGPDLFIREYGHPRLRMRHFPFTIGKAERDQWLLCMNLALNEQSMETGFRDSLNKAFAELATHMINTAG